jgi:hypothetical protein
MIGPAADNQLVGVYRQVPITILLVKLRDVKGELATEDYFIVELIPPTYGG